MYSGACAKRAGIRECSSCAPAMSTTSSLKPCTIATGARTLSIAFRLSKSKRSSFSDTYLGKYPSDITARNAVASGEINMTAQYLADALDAMLSVGTDPSDCPIRTILSGGISISLSREYTASMLALSVDSHNAALLELP